ncbi:unnamed protein product [Ostreobium quekettii]|uniref:Ionotropic glutamate receptor C-terminal domain-containing protein n=1 Tax=Ostreobium quekettii TaxID=121088 RepID=A0A8S1J089_9CHLO|nr:unnamed protein product [Ostreobium quekettii]|eukprot:evm.model.scf_488EXC.7 EVM.evm.TU.scf_488EXC.7   scf_488EXC:50654-53218(+)
MVVCDPGEDPATFAGHDIAQMRLVARRLGWAPANYTFKCIQSFGSLIADLKNGSECSMAASAITRSAERQKEGIQFSYPTYRASLGVMVNARVREGSHWGFLTPLHWSVWLSTTLTALAVPLLVFVIESVACHGFVHHGDWVHGLRNATWDSLIALVNFGHFQVKSTAARMVVLGYGFLVLIIIQTYVANLAAFLTISQVETAFSKIEDLYGQRVATVEVYETQLRRQGIIPIIMVQDDDILSRFVRGLRSSHFKAVVMDEPWMTNTVKNGSSCDLQMLPETFIPFDYAFAFPPRAPREFVDMLSRELLRMQEDLNSTRIADTYIRSANGSCPERNYISDTQAVTIDKVVGLWIILAFCIALAAVNLFWNRFCRVSKSPGDSAAVVQCKLRQASRLKRMKRTPTTYHPNASAELERPSCHCREFMQRVGDVQDVIATLADEIQRLAQAHHAVSMPVAGIDIDIDTVSISARADEAGEVPCAPLRSGSFVAPGVWVERPDGTIVDIDDVVAHVHDSAKSRTG